MTATIPSGGGAPSRNPRSRVAGQRRSARVQTAPAALPAAPEPTLAPAETSFERIERKTRLPRRIFIGAIIGIACLFVTIFFSVLLTHMGGGSGQTSSNNAPVNTEPAVVSAPAPKVNLPAVTRPTADTPPGTVIAELLAIRQKAFCTGGQAGVGLLDYVWETHGTPEKMPFTLPDPNFPGQAANANPTGTWPADSASITSGQADCPAPLGAHSFRLASVRVINPTQSMIQFFIVTSGGAHGYVAVVDLVNGHWVFNQLRD